MQVEIAENVKGKLRKALKAAGSREIGGVMMGEQIAPGHFRVVDLSIDSQTGGKAHFVRDSETHNEALNAFFTEQGINMIDSTTLENGTLIPVSQSHRALRTFPQ